MTDLLTIDQAASSLGVSDRTIRRYIARRKLAVIRLGYRTARIRPVDLEKLKDKLTEKSIF